jgi:hypothetical protein
MPPDPKCQVFTGGRMGLVRGWVGHVSLYAPARSGPGSCDEAEGVP